MALIFHVASQSDWVGAQLTGEYTTSTRGRTLADEGFIHCSRYLQVDDVLSGYYADATEPLVLLSISTQLLAAPLQWDDVPGAAMSFPHIYGPLNADAVIAATPLEHAVDGSFGYPWFLPGPLAGDRVVVRQASADDRPAYRRTLVDDAQRVHLGGAVPEAEADGRNAEVDAKGCLAIDVATDHGRKVVGFALLGFYRTGDFEVSVNILAEHQRRGYAREAVATAIDWAFAVFTHLPRIVGVAQLANEAGCALLQDLDFVERDHFVEWGERQVLFERRNPVPR